MSDTFDNGDEMEAIELADLWADIVCGNDKQDVSAILVAPKGYGKSYTAMGLCYDSAVAIAKRKGGPWQDYFPYDPETKEIKNVACIVQKDIVKLMGVTRPNNVYLLDDVAVGMNSRKFASDNNILINEIFMLMRVDSCITVTTTMDQSYVDKVPREIIGWYVEIVEPHHDEGYNILKVFKNKKQFRTGKMHQVYINDKIGRYTRFIAERPPDFLAEAYDILRSKKTAEHRKARLEEYLNIMDGDVPLSKRERNAQEDLTKWGDKILDLKQEGKTPAQITKLVPLSREKITRIYAAVSQ